MGSRAYKKENKPFVTGLVVILIVIIAFQQWMIVGYKQAVVGAQEMPPVGTMSPVGYYSEEPSEEAPTEAPTEEGVTLTVPTRNELTEADQKRFEKKYFNEGDILNVQWQGLEEWQKRKFFENLSVEDRESLVYAMARAEPPPEGVTREEHQANINSWLTTIIKYTNELGEEVEVSVITIITVGNLTFFYALDAWMAKGKILRYAKSMAPYFQFANHAKLGIMMDRATRAASAVKDAQAGLALSSAAARSTWEGMVANLQKGADAAAKNSDNAMMQLIRPGKSFITTNTTRAGSNLIVEVVETYNKGGKVYTKVKSCTTFTRGGRILRVCKNPKVIAVVAIASILGYSILSGDEEEAPGEYPPGLDFYR